MPSSVAAAVAQAKERHPQWFCPEPRCLWRTGDGSRCPRHVRAAQSPLPDDVVADLRALSAEDEQELAEWLDQEDGYREERE